MRDFSKLIWCALALTLVVGTALPARAEISVELAKKCREMAIKAHPPKLYTSSGSAAAQRAYFQKCIRQQGNMEPAASKDEAGQPQPSTGDKAK